GVAAAHGLPTVLDSGAWSVFNAGATIDPLKQAAFVVKASALYPEARFLALDVIGDEEATWRNWVLQRRAGARVEPTIHFGAEPLLVRRFLTYGLARMPD